MNYVSTRDTSVKVSSAQAITRGISADGGLFVPESFPSVSLERIEQLSKLDYIGRAKAILSLYLTDFTEEELDSCVRGAYESGFSSEKSLRLQSSRTAFISLSFSEVRRVLLRTWRFRCSLTCSPWRAKRRPTAPR